MTIKLRVFTSNTHIISRELDSYQEILCGLPLRGGSRICKLTMVYTNRAQSRTLTFYRPAPWQQPNMTPGFDVGWWELQTSCSLLRHWRANSGQFFSSGLLHHVQSALVAKSSHMMVKWNEIKTVKATNCTRRNKLYKNRARENVRFLHVRMWHKRSLFILHCLWAFCSVTVNKHKPLCVSSDREPSQSGWVIEVALRCSYCLLVFQHSSPPSSSSWCCSSLLLFVPSVWFCVA